MRKLVLTLIFICASFCLFAESGIASWYTSDRSGALTANGEFFDPGQLTAAHKSLTFGTVVKVTNVENGLSIQVRIHDRGPFVENRIIDLIPEGARQLGYYDQGIAEVSLEIVSEPDEPQTEYVDGRQTGWYTVQIGAYTNMQSAYDVLTGIKNAGLKPSVEIISDNMIRISVKNIQAYRLKGVLSALEEAGIKEPLVKGARSPYK